MSCTCPIITLSPYEYDAVVFDLDGVLTKTAVVHAQAWKKLFDEFLESRSGKTGQSFIPFDLDTDYRQYVDGKPRYDGVVAFLESRGLHLPFGTPEDGPETHTVCALGNLKDQYFLNHVQQYGIETYDSAIALVRTLRAQAIQTAIVSSNNNCAAVLAPAGIAHLFDARVDGRDLTRLHLKGKPAPDAFLEGARRLGVSPRRTVVVEDAIAGVEAGHAGQFGCVIGIDRGGNSEALRKAGADVVVTNLAQLHVSIEPPSAWALSFEGFHPAEEGNREALCALGNGYFATRGALPWSVADDIHYPGTYLAGGYNRLRTEVNGQVVENEDLVNFPNWLFLRFRIADQPWFELPNVRVLSYRQVLDLQQGMLSRTIRFEDDHGRRSRLRERRMVSMHDKHISALSTELTAENWSGRVTVCSAIDGRIVNAGAKLYQPFNNQHLEWLASEVVNPETLFLLIRTNQSFLHVAQAIRTQGFLDGNSLEGARQTIQEPGYIGQEFVINLLPGKTLLLEKTASVYSSRDYAISECGLQARRTLKRAGRFESLLGDHMRAWKHLWDRFDIHLHPAGSTFQLNVSLLLRLNMFHLLQTISPNSIGLDVGVPARGWTGEGYQGHIFWDELFIFPLFNYRMPEITRSLLLYRYRRLDEAREAAKTAGYKGAMFPWQSGSDGQEETQVFNLNPRSQRWMRDHTYLQRHVGSAIAFNFWHYFQVTHDIEFLQSYGAELIFEIARFWSSIAHWNESRGRYEIHGVMGPDEFHDRYPNALHPGLNNNAYTNIMAVWVLSRALEVWSLLPDIRRAELNAQLELSKEELSRWDDISRKMYVPFQQEGIISQFEGYETLAEFDWEGYQARYGNIQRLDLILEAENDSPNRYKLSKQADVLMLFYLFSAEELAELFTRLEYPFESQTIPRNVAYYADRLSRGSTLCRVVCAWVMARSDRPRAMRFFSEALQSDVNDIQHGTTAEGIHLGAMAGTVDLIQRVSTGIEAQKNLLRLNPELPQEIGRLDMRIRYRGQALDLRLTHDALTIQGHDLGIPSISLCIHDKIKTFSGGTTQVFPLRTT